MLLWLNVKNRQQLFEGVLTIKAGIGQISSFRFPLRKATVIKHLFGVFNNERNDTVPQAFFECYQTANSAIAVLERMNAFKVVVEFDDIFY